MAVTQGVSNASAKSLKESLKTTAAPAFNGVKVFSATMMADRHELGEKVTSWIAAHPSYKLDDIVVSQSSDQAFHCIAITVFYTDPAARSRLVG